MTSRVIGAVLLIVGTSLGGGMLALPMATAAAGYWYSMGLFIAIWVLTLIAAGYTLEASMYLPEGSHFVSMARRTWGRFGALFVGFLLFSFLYMVLSAYTASGGGLVSLLVSRFHGNWPSWLHTVLFTLLFSIILYRGVLTVDWVNRGLMLVKCSAYVMLVIMMLPGAHLQALSVAPGSGITHLSGALLVVMTAFGFGGSIPTIRSYCRSHQRSLIKALVVGSLIPLICYLLWDWAVQGTVPSAGPGGLIELAHSSHAVVGMTLALEKHYPGHVIPTAISWFTSLCVTTSYLGVGVGLVDLAADTLSIDRNSSRMWIPTVVATVPPMILVLMDPGLFMRALAYAGVLCVLLLTVCPMLMVWRGRYVHQLTADFQMPGGRRLLFPITAFSVCLFGFMCYFLFS